jgi:predicted metal-dependent hydrolase
MCEKQFVHDDGLPYLRRTHRLRLADAAEVTVRLVSGRFEMPRAPTTAGRQHMIRWYVERARPRLTGKVEDSAARMKVAPAGVRVQDLGYRWGSCGKGDWLYFHWKTMLLPARIAEYVVVHEMAHLQEPHHTPEFWRRVERAMPDYDRRKRWLAKHGMGVEEL